MSNIEPDRPNPEPAPNLQDLIDAAIALQEQGLNVIPLRTITPQAKRPFLKEGELKDPGNGFHHRRSTIEDIEKWQQRDRYSRTTGSDWRWEGLAIVTGKTSGVFVLDSDGPEGEAQIKKYGDPHTWKARTGKGYQRYYRLPEGIEIPNKIRLLPEIDIKAERGIAVIPPSLHYNGKRYLWINSPFATPLADAPAWLINTIQLALGEGLTETEYSSVPRELIEHLKQNGSGRQSSGSGKAKAKGDVSQVRIPFGQRNDILFRKACRWRYRGFEEEEICQKLRAHNEIYCEPDQEGELLSDEEISTIARSACKHPKGDPAPLEVLRATEAVFAYYRKHPPKGMAECTDKDIIEAFLREALTHCSIVKDGIEISISHSILADRAGISNSTLARALYNRLFPSGWFKKGKNPRGTNSGSLVLITSEFYASWEHSNGKVLSALGLHKSQIDDVHSRWGKDRFGKTRNHLLKRIEEAVHQIEGDLTPKKIVEFLNDGVTQADRLIKSTSISRHLSKMCEAGVLERVRRGVYRLKEDRYRNLGDHMRETREFESIHNQRMHRIKRQEEYKRFLDSLGVDWEGGEEPSPETIEKIVGWNQEEDWQEIEPFVEAAKEGRSVSPRPRDKALRRWNNAG